MRKHGNNFFHRLFGKIAAAAGAFALIAGAAHAQNNFTDAGTNVENTFTLDYEVSGTSQPTITNDPGLGGGSVLQGAPTEFTVDRLIDLQVTQQNSPLTVAPGTTNAALDFLVINEGNDNQAYSFDVVDVAGDDFDGTYTIEYFIDADSDGDPFNDPATTVTVTPTGTANATLAQITPDIAPDQTIGVRVTTNIPGSATDGDADDLVLVAETRDPLVWLEPLDSSGSTSTTTRGELTEEDSDNNTDTGDAENVFADSNGATGEEADNDGLHSDAAQYLVASPDLTAAKSVDIVATEPVNCATDAVGGATEYSVPGACVEYVITVDNNGSTSADAIDIADILPAEVDFVSAVAAGWDTAPTVTSPSGAAATCDGTAATCNVTLTGATLDAGETGTLTIHALVK